MNYHNITHDDMNNGSGLRVVAWVAGCSHHCHLCQNPQTWNPKSGIPFDEAAKQEIFTELSKDYISGLTLSGGDPLFKDNTEEIYELVVEVKQKFPTKTIWLYTGYNFEYLQQKFNEYKYTPFANGADEWLIRWEIISNTDILVDGEYIDEQRDVTLKWRGSRNQRVINLAETIKKGEIVLWTE